MGIKRIVDTSFWTDVKVDEFSPEDKYFMLYLLTNPFSSQLGIYEISIKQVAFQLGYSTDAVNVLLERFENKYGMILFSKSTNEIGIKNFLRHSIIKGGAPVRDCLIKEIKKVKNKDLISAVFLHIKDSEDLNETVKNIIAEYEEKNGDLYYCHSKQNDQIENDNDKDNENDNENDVSSPYRGRYVDESQYEQIKADILDNKNEGSKTCEWCGCKTSILHKHHYPVSKREGGKETVNICSNCHNEFHSKEREILGGSWTNLDVPEEGKRKKPVRHKYGEYKNVLLTDEEMDKLITEFSDWEERIERLSSYMASTGKSYKSHLATIRNWARKDQSAKVENKRVYQKQTKAEELNEAYRMMAAWSEGE